MKPSLRKRFLFTVGSVCVIAGAIVLYAWEPGATTYYALDVLPANIKKVLPPEPPLRHIDTPEYVKAVYMTSWVAATPSLRAKLVDFIESTEINAVVIDVKDYTGRISFDTDDPFIDALGSEDIRVQDMPAFIQELHDKNIYTIARISVFQDPYLALERPDIAVHRSDGTVWKDRKGLSWIDPTSKEAWDYIVKVAKASERAGFDELNFDYVRFPSDGNLRDISYPMWDRTVLKSDALEEFFAYLNTELEDVGVPISLDLFGITATYPEDVGIGQILEKAAPHADYLAFMVYPSHYDAGFQGFQNPAEHPYEIVNYAMSTAVNRLIAASSTPAKLRPWLQDFDLGATYTADMVRKQIQATYDAGLNSWMIWDPSNVYTREAYLPEVINN